MSQQDHDLAKIQEVFSSLHWYNTAVSRQSKTYNILCDELPVCIFVNHYLCSYLLKVSGASGALDIVVEAGSIEELADVLVVQLDEIDKLSRSLREAFCEWGSTTDE